VGAIEIHRCYGLITMPDSAIRCRLRAFWSRMGVTAFLQPSTECFPNVHTVTGQLAAYGRHMKKLFSVVPLMLPLIGLIAMPDAIATAHADPVVFAPDWPVHPNHTEKRYAQRWHRVGHGVRSSAPRKTRTTPT